MSSLGNEPVRSQSVDRYERIRRGSAGILESSDRSRRRLPSHLEGGSLKGFEAGAQPIPARGGGKAPGCEEVENLGVCRPRPP